VNNGQWLILFDLDGVLADIKHIHYQTLNRALEEVGPQFVINHRDHLQRYDGLKTTAKLQKMSAERGLDPALHKRIWERKQQLTAQALTGIESNPRLQELMKSLCRAGFQLAVCSNSIRQTVCTVLDGLGVTPFLDLVLSNEDIQRPKPHPEIYWRAMSQLNGHPTRTVIVEDSPAGLEAAHYAGAKVLQVKNSQDLTLEKIMDIINDTPVLGPRWKNKNLNIVIPMGGAGRRFAEKGYTFPKPLIEVEGQPMIQRVVQNLQVDGRFIFIVDSATLEKYNLEKALKLLAPGCIVIPETGPRQGAAYATLLAREYIDNDHPVLLANCDQLVEWDAMQFLYKCQEQEMDGSILTFESVHPKWSYARTDEDGRVLEVAEKNPISNQATVGIYLWSKGSNYIRSLQQMIDKDIRVNGEYYVCPVFNEGIAQGLNFSTYQIQTMHGIGTPEDLEAYLARK